MHKNEKKKCEKLHDSKYITVYYTQWLYADMARLENAKSC